MSVKPIFFALDGKELSEFTETLKKLKGVIYGVKVGLEMFTAEGPSSVEKLKNDGWKVFLDLKLHDIPNTVQAATVSAGNIGADYLTIHIASEKEALLAASENKTDNIKLQNVNQNIFDINYFCSFFIDPRFIYYSKIFFIFFLSRSIW